MDNLDKLVEDKNQVTLVSMADKLKLFDEHTEFDEDVEKDIKDKLTTYRKQAELVLDEQKLGMAMDTISSLEAMIAKVRNPETIDGIEIKTAMDLKLMTEAIERSLKVLDTLMRLDTIDGRGTPNLTKISIQFEDNGGYRGQPMIKL